MDAFYLHALGQYQTNMLLLWDRPRSRAFYCVLHALRQYQTNERILWDRPTSCFLTCFIDETSDSVGSPRLMFLLRFARIGPISD